MTDWFPILLVGGISTVFCLSIAGILYGYRKQKEQIAALQSSVLQKGWTYSKESDGHRRFDWVRELQTGGSRKSRHQISGRINRRDFEAFEHSYVVQSDKSSTVVLHTVVVMTSTASHEGLRIYPRHLGHSIMGWFGKSPKGTGNAQFDKQFVAKRADDEEPRRVGALMQDVVMRHPKVRWTWLGEQLVATRQGGMNAQSLDRVVTAMAEFARAADGTESEFRS